MGHRVTAMFGCVTVMIFPASIVADPGGGSAIVARLAFQSVARVEVQKAWRGSIRYDGMHLIHMSEHMSRM